MAKNTFLIDVIRPNMTRSLLKSKKKGRFVSFDEYYVFGAEYTLSAPWNLCYNRYKVRVNDISVSFNW